VHSSHTDGGCSSVDAVFNQLLCHGAEVDNDLARLNLMDLFGMSVISFPLLQIELNDRRTALDSMALIVALDAILWHFRRHQNC
jgi:hypothetical protein